MAIDKETDQYQNSNLLQKKADLKNFFTTVTTKESPVSLSLSQTCQLHEEIKLFDQFSGIDLGKIDAKERFTLQKSGLNEYFDTVCEKVVKKCQLITSVTKALVEGTNIQDNSERNALFKFKQALPLLTFITHFRSQKSLSDFPNLFGLLLIANGGGKSILTVLSSIGLCKSYEW